MSVREALWPELRPEWIRYEDADLIAVHKAAGIPSQASEPGASDDLPSRVQRFLEARDGVRVRLGIHQRLDRDTSGVIVYAKRKEANAELARQFEGRTVEKLYEACVERWAGQGEGERVLRDAIAEGRDGRMVVADRGREAITRVRVGARSNGRSRLEVKIETGRTHQIRVQLAHVGSPVAGDSLYGGPPASRLMLHAREIALRHPSTGAELRVVDPAPPELEAWLARGAGAAMHGRESIERALRCAAERRWALAHADRAVANERTTTFRFAHDEGDGLPGVGVDVYGEHLVVHLSGAAAETSRDAIVDAAAALGFAGVYLKVHPRQANLAAETRRADLAPSVPVRGMSTEDGELVVHEHGLPFVVRLGDGLSTGLFLDQRENRLRIRQVAEGAKVLNLFAYTGGFTLAAAAGGARRTVTVDASRASLDWAERNLADAGLASRGEHRFVAADAFRALDGFVHARERFDLIVLDPPSYSTTKATRFSADRDYARLAAAALRVLGPGGKLLACTNHRGIGRARFRRDLHEAARLAARRVAQMKDLPPQIDFPVAWNGEPQMKSVLVTVD